MRFIGFGEPDVSTSFRPHQGFCDRLGNAFAGVCFGFIFVLGGLAGIFWNESNYVAYQHLYQIALSQYEPVKDCQFTSGSYDNKLIQCSTTLSNLTQFQDSAFTPAITSTALTFQRNVLVYLWYETRSSYSCTDSYGRKGSCTQATYSLRWATPGDSNTISSNFIYCKKHGVSTCRYQNPLTYQLYPQSWNAASGVRVGSYMLGKTLTDKLDVQIPAISLKIPSASYKFENSKAFNLGSYAGTDTLYTGSDMSSPLWLNYRVSYASKTLDPQQKVTVLAAQKSLGMSEPTFAPWSDPTGTVSTRDTLIDIRIGQLTIDEQINLLQAENTSALYGLRVAFFLLTWLGFHLVVAPIAMMPQILPFVGDALSGMVGCALCGATFIIAAALCLVDFGLAWLYARPSMGAPLLGGGILCCCVFYIYRRQHKRQRKGLDPYDGVGDGYGALPSAMATTAPPTTVIYGVPAATAAGAVPTTAQGYVTYAQPAQQGFQYQQQQQQPQQYQAQPPLQMPGVYQ